MARYLIQASYNRQGISDLVQNPQNRLEAIRPVVERLGGRVISFDYAFGDYDVVAIMEAPDNVSAAALAMAVGWTGGGAMAGGAMAGGAGMGACGHAAWGAKACCGAVGRW